MKNITAFQLVLIAFILIFFNLVAGLYFFRWDLTQEKRYSLSDISVQSVDSIDGILTAKCYLDGNFPPQLKRFQDAILTTLMELKYYSNDNIQYKFIDPTDDKSLQKEFEKKGITPIPASTRSSDEVETKINLFPVIILNYQGREEIIDLFRNCVFPDGRTNMLKAEQDIEFKIVSAIRRIKEPDKPIIGILNGHNEVSPKFMPEFMGEMKNYFTLVPVNLKNGIGIPASPKFLPDSIRKNIKGKGLDVLVVAQPDSLFSEREKYEIDQYIMQGGRILWILDQQYVSLDNKSTLSQPRKLNLDDMFYKYGFKINDNLIQDKSAGKIHLVFDSPKGQQFKPLYWPFYPLVYKFYDHPITKNLDAVLMRYASSIDTFKREGISFFPILSSSPLSRVLEGTVTIDLNEQSQPIPDNLLIDKGNKLLGLSVEGNFQSLFMGRQAPVDKNAPNKPTAPFLPSSPYGSKMVVLSDGQLVMKDDHPYIPYMPVDNKTLLMNSLDYLTGDEALSSIRAKTVEFRPLNRQLVKGNEFYYQFINLVAPILIIILFGIGLFYWRKRKYETNI